MIKRERNSRAGIRVILGLTAVVLLIFGCFTTTTTSTPTASDTSTVQLTSTSTSQPTETVTPPPIPVTGETLRVYFFDVGQGDATLLLEPNGKTILIDGGESNTGIVQDLQAIGISRIDLMIATHLHSDHIGGLVQVLSFLPVAEVATNGEASNTKIYEDFLDGIATAKAEYREVKRGDQISIGTLTFDVLNPPSALGDSVNSNSVVLRLVYGKIAFLFMGDAERDAEASILSAGLPVQADILKVGHHASTSSSGISFLAQVKPQVAIYFAGIGNPFGHPHTQTLQHLSAIGARIFGTDVNGTITVTSDGNSYEVIASKHPVSIIATPFLELARR